jgi:uncharacterized protein YukE
MDNSAIALNYEKAINYANELAGIADLLKNDVSQSINEAKTITSSSWDGQNSIKYVNKVSLVNAKNKASAIELETLASTIRAAAQRVYEAEMEALRIEKEREYLKSLEEINKTKKQHNRKASK